MAFTVGLVFFIFLYMYIYSQIIRVVYLFHPSFKKNGGGLQFRRIFFTNRIFFLYKKETDGQGTIKLLTETRNWSQCRS